MIYEICIYYVYILIHHIKVVVRVNSLEIIKELNLPKYVIPIGGLYLGYPDDDPGLKPRLPMSAVFFEEKYDTEKAKAGIDEFDETYQIFKRKRFRGKR